MKLFIVFIVLNVLNVIIQTVKSIATIKCNKYIASLVNALAYGLYTVVIVYMVCDLPLWLKVVIVALANLLGVFTVKFIEEKREKEKLWKIEIAIENLHTEKMHTLLEDVPHNYIKVGAYTMFNVYCETKKDTQKVKTIAKMFNAKISAYESATTL